MMISWLRTNHREDRIWHRVHSLGKTQALSVAAGGIGPRAEPPEIRLMTSLAMGYEGIRPAAKNVLRTSTTSVSCLPSSSTDPAIREAGRPVSCPSPRVPVMMLCCSSDSVRALSWSAAAVLPCINSNVTRSRVAIRIARAVPPLLLPPPPRQLVPGSLSCEYMVMSRRIDATALV